MLIWLHSNLHSQIYGLMSAKTRIKLKLGKRNMNHFMPYCWITANHLHDERNALLISLANSFLNINIWLNVVHCTWKKCQLILSGKGIALWTKCQHHRGLLHCLHTNTWGRLCLNRETSHTNSLNHPTFPFQLVVGVSKPSKVNTIKEEIFSTQ